MISYTCNYFVTITIIDKRTVGLVTKTKTSLPAQPMSVIALRLSVYLDSEHFHLILI